MIREFPLPDLGEGLTESEIVAWRVAVGDRVELNQIIADVETAKAVVELPSPYAGVITALHAAEGETVNVGEPLFSCDTGDGAARRMPRPRAAARCRGRRRRPPGAPPPRTRRPPRRRRERDAAPGPNLVGYGARDEGGPKRRMPAARRSRPTSCRRPSGDADADAAPPAAPRPRRHARRRRR